MSSAHIGNMAIFNTQWAVVHVYDKNVLNCGCIETSYKVIVSKCFVYVIYKGNAFLFLILLCRCSLMVVGRSPPLFGCRFAR